jgi:integrase
MAQKRHRSHITLPGYRKGEDPPNKGLKLPPEVLTPDELERLMETFDRRSKRGVRNAAMTALMARAGLKVGQVVALQRRHYQPGQGW